MRVSKKFPKKKRGFCCSKNPASGGEGGIRTHVPVRTTRFRVALVMTSSILLRVYLNCLQSFKLDLQVADFWKLFLETVKNNAIQFSYKPSHNAVCNGLELH